MQLTMVRVRGSQEIMLRLEQSAMWVAAIV